MIDGGDKGSEVRPDVNALLVAIGTRRDRDAFAALFRAAGPRLLAYVRKMGADEGTGEEVLQEVLLSVWKRADSFDPTRASGWTWLYRIARNRCIDRFRRHRSGEVLSDMTDVMQHQTDARPSPLDNLEASRMMRRAVRILPSEQTEILWKAYFEGKSSAHIAEEMSVPIGTVKSRLRLALGRLRAEMVEGAE